MLEIRKTPVLHHIQLCNTGLEPLRVIIGTQKTGLQSRVLLPGESLELPKGTRYRVAADE